MSKPLLFQVTLSLLQRMRKRAWKISWTTFWDDADSSVISLHSDKSMAVSLRLMSVCSASSQPAHYVGLISLVLVLATPTASHRFDLIPEQEVYYFAVQSIDWRPPLYMYVKDKRKKKSRGNVYIYGTMNEVFSKNMKSTRER